MPVPPPQGSTPFDLAAAFAKLREGGLGTLLSTFGLGQGSSSSPPPTQPPGAPWQPPGSLDFRGRLPFEPGYSGFSGLSGQPLGDDGLITFRSGGGSRPPDMIQDADGLLVANPMAKAFKARQAAGDDAQRQAQSDETDAMIEEFGKAKARKDAAWDQESAARSAYDAQRSEAESQALMAQRSTRKTPGRGGYLRMGRGGRGGARG